MFESTPATSFQVGQRIGNYQVVRLIGEGGMGLVYEVVHHEIERRAAIKVLHPEHSRHPDVPRRFLNEARALSRIQHPGLVQVFDFGRMEDGVAYLVMEFLAGESLRTRLGRAAPLDEAVAAGLGRQIALALSAAHEAGVIHRDLKPDNVMLVPDAEAPGGERAKLLDFGIAKLTRGGGMRTRSNMIVGTAAYMAPEQCRGEDQIDGRVDVYALGIMLYEMLSGRPPFVAAEDVEVMTLHLRAAPAPLPAARASAGMGRLIERMLAKNPVERPAIAQVAADLAELSALRQSSSSVPPISGSTGRRAGPTMARGLWLGVVLLGLSVTGWWWLRARQPVLSVVRASAAAPVATPAPPPPAARVHWVITTVPPGAKVLRAGTTEVLGITPWHGEHLAGKGALKITLKLSHYQRKEVFLPLSHDEDRHEELDKITDENLEVPSL